jgi:anti-anti-sigma factor
MSQLSPSPQPTGNDLAERRHRPKRRWIAHPSSVYPPTLTLRGELDSADTVDLARTLWHLSHGATCSLTVDVGQLDFIDVSALRTLDHIANQLAFNDRHLHLINVPPRLARILALTNFHELRTAARHPGIDQPIVDVPQSWVQGGIGPRPDRAIGARPMPN